MKRTMVLLVGMFLLFGSSGCTSKPIPISGEEATKTPELTKTPTTIPTKTLAPTATQMPTLTVTDAQSNQLGGSNVTPRAKAEESGDKEFEVPTPLFDFLSNPIITDFDDFNNNSMIGWDRNSQVRNSNGVVEITGQGDWGSVFRRKEMFSEGEGVIFLYKYDSGAEFEYFFDYGGWGDPDYKRWGVYSGKDTYMNIFKGTSWVDGLSGSYLIGNLTLTKEHWYYAALTIDGESNLLAIIWDKDDPTRRVKYKGKFTEEWTGKEWGFSVGANLGKVYVDSYAEFTYDEFLP